MTFHIIGSILPEVTIAIAICVVILVNSLIRNVSVAFIHSMILFFLSFFWIPFEHMYKQSPHSYCHLGWSMVN